MFYYKQVQFLISRSQKFKIGSWKSESEYVPKMITYICYQPVKLGLEFDLDNDHATSQQGILFISVVRHSTTLHFLM